MEFDLIKQVVQYAKDIFWGKPITFNMTSNASLINQEIMEFLSLHSIRLMISLDGPKEIHDNKRKFAVNGCGTFDKVMEKLQFVKTKFPQYYHDNISFSTVIDPSKEFDCINEMSFRYDFLADARIMATLIDDAYSEEKNTYSEEYIEQSRYEEFKTFLNETGRIQIEKLSAISRQRAEGEKTFFKTIGSYKIYDEMSHGGPCVIGERRLFSDVYGNLYPCERVSESSSVMRIGNINTGFEMKKINNLINIARLTQESCNDCWAINRCMICARYADDGQKLCMKNILQQCEDSISSVEYQIRRYLAVKELQTGGNI